MNHSIVSIRKSLRAKSSIWSLVLAAALPVSAQLPSTGQLSDAQAAAMVQALNAQAQSGMTPAITQAQVQMLMQYMARQSTPANAMQAQMMMQAMAQSAGAAPNAAISAAQAQSLARMLSQQPQAFTGVQPHVPAAPQSNSLLGAKKPGTIRIGVLGPKAQMTQNGQGANISEPLRSAIVRYLSGPMLEVASISALLPQQAEAEAKQIDCDYVLYSSVTQKTSSGGMGLLKKAMPAASMIPMVGMAGGMAGAASAAAGTAMGGAASIAGSVKAKSEVTFEYKLVSVASGATIAANSTTAKTHADGEDVITPLIEQADAAILSAVTRK